MLVLISTRGFPLTSISTSILISPLISLLHSLGWNHKVELDEGLRMVYQDFIKRAEQGSIP